MAPVCLFACCPAEPNAMSTTASTTFSLPATAFSWVADVATTVMSPSIASAESVTRA